MIPGFGSRQQALFAENAVDERRFSGVGPPNDRDAQRLRYIEVAAVLLVVAQIFFNGDVVFERLGGLLGQSLAQRVIERAHAFAMLGG